MEHVHRLRVRYAECDMQGHVFNANYFTWFDVAHTELWRTALGPFQRLVDDGLDVVVAEASARFHAGARFDEEIDLAIEVTALSSTSMTSRLSVRRGDEVVCSGELRHVCFDFAAQSKRPWPHWVRDGLAPYVADEAAAGAANE